MELGEEVDRQAAELLEQQVLGILSSHELLEVALSPAGCGDQLVDGRSGEAAEEEGEDDGHSEASGDVLDGWCPVGGEGVAKGSHGGGEGVEVDVSRRYGTAAAV